MTPSPRPGFGELLDWLEGRLDATGSATMAERVAGGDHATQRTVAWIRTFLDSARQHPLAEPPPILRQRLRQAFEAHVEGSTGVDRLQARLSFDSRSGPELVGVRSTERHELGSYQLAFRALSGSSTIDVLLDVTEEGAGSFRLDGQVFASETQPSAAVWEAVVEQDAGTRRDITGDDLGSFSVQGVASGPARLVLANGRLEVEVPLIVVPASG